MAYDTVRNRVVLFGGQDISGYRNDTWEWGNGVWTQKATNGPVARRDHVLARRGNRIVLYGGVDSGNNPLADTWEWDGTSWTQTATGCPSARYGASAATDPFTGKVLLFGGSGPVNVDADTALYGGPIITANPVSRTNFTGTTATFSVSVNSAGSQASYQWERNCGTVFQPISGATAATLTLNNVQVSDACLYHCVVQVNGCSATSLAAQLSVPGPCPPVSYTVTIPSGYSLIANQVDTGGNTLKEIFPNGPPGAVIYKWDSKACSYVASTFDDITLSWTPNITLNPGEGAWFYNPGPPFSHTYTGCAHTPVLPITLPTNCCALVSAQTNVVGTISNIVGMPLPDGTAVYIWNGNSFVVYYADSTSPTGWTDAGGNPVTPPTVGVGQSLWICCPTCPPPGLPGGCVPPKITTQPTNETVEACSCATFVVVATGTSPLSYQWQLNGVNIAGATGSSYTKCPVTLVDNGSTYQVFITNACGAVSSVIVTLTVVDHTSPTINCPTNDIVVAGIPSQGTNVFYNVTATDCDPKVTIVCTPPSGSLFPCGTNTVICRATDSSGNVSACEFHVIVTCDCMGILHEQFTAGTGVPGQYTYTFDLQNFTGLPIKYLFVQPTAGCQTISPDIIYFTPPLAPGNTTNVTTTITLTGACATNRCFSLSAHTTNLTECCAMIHCVPSALPRPTLDISISGGNVTLSWPDSYPDYILECTPSLSPPTVWTTVTANRTFQNGRIYVTVPLASAAKFFRLRTP
jgi:hypothetical protein